MATVRCAQWDEVGSCDDLHCSLMHPGRRKVAASPKSIVENKKQNKPCFKFNSPEGCFNANCWYLHVLFNAFPCPHYAEGRCRSKENCKYSHVGMSPKKLDVVCSFLAQGKSCSFGKNCRFLHPASVPLAASAASAASAVVPVPAPAKAQNSQVQQLIDNKGQPRPQISPLSPFPALPNSSVAVPAPPVPAPARAPMAAPIPVPMVTVPVTTYPLTNISSASASAAAAASIVASVGGGQQRICVPCLQLFLNSHRCDHK
jgi:hypothetical protein